VKHPNKALLSVHMLNVCGTASLVWLSLVRHQHEAATDTAPTPAPPSQTWAGKEENWAAAQEILGKLAKANGEAQLGQFKGPHPVPGGGRILQALRTGGSGK
jgi:hypothetical protein